jgi:7-cyano-7-deazaguanine synthase
MQAKAVVLLSGGIDSATAAYWAVKRRGWEAHALSLNYGHKAQKELECAAEIAKRICASHKVLDLSVLKEVLKSPLTDMDIKQEENDREGDSYYVVPVRNIIFLSIATAYAESIGAENVVIGNHLDDAKGFPDCRPEAMWAMQDVVDVASEEGKAPVLWSPWLVSEKKEIIKRGVKLGVPYEFTYSCYQDHIACGVCEACEYRYQAFLDAGSVDPIEYAVTPKHVRR